MSYLMATARVVSAWNRRAGGNDSDGMGDAIGDGMMNYSAIENRADYILAINGLTTKVFCLEDSQGVKCLYSLDDARRDPRTGERPARLVAEVFADNSVEWH